MNEISSKIISRSKIELDNSLQKMVASGWGNEVIENAIVEKITYLSDELEVKGFIAYPRDDSDKYPCIIWNRGGYGNKGAISNFNAYGIFGQISSWGYVVFASQYRGSNGGDGQDEFGGSDVNDVLNLIPLANEVDSANNSIWGIEGWSRGGMMTYLALTRNYNFKAAIVTGGIANLRCNAEESNVMKKIYQTALGNPGSDEFKSACDERSIINFADKLPRTTPLLLIHGTGDKRVLPHDSLDLSYKLLEHDIPFRLIMLEGGDHFLKSHRKEVDGLRKSWYGKYLR